MKTDGEEDGEENSVTREAQQQKCENPTPNIIQTLATTLSPMTEVVEGMKGELKATDDNRRKREKKVTKPEVQRGKVAKKDRVDEREAEEKKKRKKFEKKIRRKPRKFKEKIKQRRRNVANQNKRRHRIDLLNQTRNNWNRHKIQTQSWR